MAKKSFLMLAHKYDSKKHFIPGWYVSEKLDGIRCFYDGGITRGMPTSQVPWANCEKDARLREIPISTGLWSRYGNPIYAPKAWLDKLPNMFLDGELWIGNNSWQRLSSIVKRFDPDENDWMNVKFMVIDSPPMESIFADGIIKETNFKKTFRNIPDWIRNRTDKLVTFSKHTPFENVYRELQKLNIENEIVKIHKQIQLPTNEHKTFIEEELRRVVDKGAEGLIFRGPYSSWEPERSHMLLKYKPYLTDEVTVIGYIWGKETNLGSKHLGRIGALITLFKGQRLELAGLTDEERILNHGMIDGFFSYTVANAGKEVDQTLFKSPHFPIGSVITIKYRELSDNRLPKEASYLRKFENL